MASDATIILKLRLRWWLRAYLLGVEWFSKLTGMSPNWKKIDRAVERGTVLRQVNK